MSEPLATLPALKGLGALAGLRPVLVIDTREQTPLAFARLPSVRDTLASGDYSFRGGEELFAVERKSIADLVGCCVGENRERFFRELHRLRGFRFKRLLVVGTRREIEAGHFRSNVSPRAVLATLAAIEARFDVPVVFAATPAEAAELVESWAWWMAREITVAANNLLRGSRFAGEPDEAETPPA
ncbi:MAG: ERCC4 domain-containing protein [Opitutaceae bacterium]|nr:ERCC4 domain-containing protein [Opitutaceae bacterium]